MDTRRIVAKLQIVGSKRIGGRERGVVNKEVVEEHAVATRAKKEKTNVIGRKKKYNNCRNVSKV